VNEQEKVQLTTRGEKLVVTSSFAMKDVLKGLGCGAWDAKSGAWVFPQSAVRAVVEALGDTQLMATAEALAVNKKWKELERIVDKMHDGSLVLPTHPFLMHHQKIALYMASYFDRFALFMDTGTGKTLAALAIMSAKIKTGKFLVVCPKPLIKTAWLEDQAQWFPDLRLLPLSRNIKIQEYRDIAKNWGVDVGAVRHVDVLREKLLPHADAFIINPESLKIDYEYIKALGINGLILDESTIVRNQSDNTDVITHFADALRYCYIMSGKPDPNGSMNYFGQMRLVDTSLFGASFYAFRMRFFVPLDRNGWKWVAKTGADEEIARRVSRRAYMVKKEDCLDLPEKVYERRLLELPPKYKKMYKSMETECAMLLESGDDVVLAPIKAAALNKCRQITGGFIIKMDKEVEDLHRVKLAEMMNVLEEIGNRPVIIWAQYRHEIRAIAEEIAKTGATVVTANSETADLDESIRRFKAGEAQYMVAHPATLKFGATFILCNYVLYYSKSHDYEEYYQSHDRIYRKGQVNKCTFISLVMEDTIDEDIEKVLKLKGSASDFRDMFISRVRGEE